MKRCPTCNHDIKDQVQFCPFCASPTANAEGVIQIGSVLAGEFRVDRTMREGDPTTLFAATRLPTDTKVILSLLPRRLINAIGAETLARHLQAAARVRHPSLAAFLDFRV